MVRALKTGIARAVRWVFIVLRAALGLVLLFILKYLVLLVLGTMAVMLVVMWPYMRPRGPVLHGPGEALGPVRTHGAHD